MNVRLPAWFMILLLVAMAGLGGALGVVFYQGPQMATAEQTSGGAPVHPYKNVKFEQQKYDRLDGLTSEVKLGLLRQAKYEGVTVDQMLARMERIADRSPTVAMHPGPMDMAQEGKTAYRLFATVNIVVDGRTGYDFAEWSIDAYDMNATPVNELAKVITSGLAEPLLGYARSHAGKTIRRTP